MTAGGAAAVAPVLHADSDALAAAAETPTPEDWVRRCLETPAPSRRELLHTLHALHLSEVESRLAALKDESNRYLHVDPHKALVLAEALIAAAAAVGRPDHAALGLMAKGDALRFIGRYPQALALLDEAGDAFTTQGDELGWARTRIGWLVAAHPLGRGEEVLAVVERARDVFVRHRDWLRAGGLDLNTAVVCRDLGLYDRALELYERAGRAYESAGAAAGQRAAWAKANKAIVLTLLGHFEEALALHQEARAAFLRHGEALSALKEQQNIAFVHAGQGHYTRALRLLADALAAATRANLERNAALVMLDMVDCYLSLNRHQDAAELAQDAAERCARIGAPVYAARAQYLLALALARLGATDRALGLLDQATGSFAVAGLNRERGLATLQRAVMYQGPGRWLEAAEAAAQAHALFTELGLDVPGAQAEIALARASLALGRLDEAAQGAHRALEITRTCGVLWLAHEGHHLLGGIARARGDLEGARESYETAVGAIEQTQSRLATELRSTFLEDKLQIYEDAIDCCLRLNDPRRAFQYLERAKSRALVDYLVATPEVRLRAPTADDQELVDDLARLRREHHWFYERLHGAAFDVRAAAAPRPRDLDALRSGLAEREKQIGRVLERLALRRADVDGLPQPPTDLTIDALPTLDAETVLLEFFFGQERSAVFVVCDGGVTAVPLEASAHAIQRLLDRLHLNFAGAARVLSVGQPLGPLAANARGVLQELHGALLAPVADWLEGRRRLVIVPYGVTHAVPFHALHNGRGYLAERMETSVSPSSTLLRICAGRPRPEAHTALVMAYSDGGRLPHVLHEAEAVAAVMPGERYVEKAATRARLVAAAPRHGVIHLAAHGEARPDNPAFAHLKLADGQLSTADVFNLPLEGTLVTLSACETGRSVVRGGDELIGLSRGFLYAGVSALVQSLWRVEDGAAARLMARFYQALRDGTPRAAALREAQLALMDECGPHPFLWAPFQLVGDGGSGAAQTGKARDPRVARAA